MNSTDRISKVELDRLSVRTRNVMSAYGIATAGDLAALDHDAVLAMRNAGKKTADEIMALRAKCLADGMEEDPPEESAETLPLTVAPETPLPVWALRKLSVRSRKRLVAAFPHVTVGDVCSLDEKAIRAWDGAGKLVVAEILALKRRFLADDIASPVTDDEPGAAAFSSLAEMLVELEGSHKPQFEQVMRRYMGLLNVNERCTLEVCGSELGVSRERVRQIAVKAEKHLFYFPRRKALAEVEAVVKDCFEARELEAPVSDLQACVDAALGWTGTTAFSLGRLMVYLGWNLVELPDGRGWGWNTDGRFDWVADYAPPTLTDKRRAAIRQVLVSAGPGGLPLEDIVIACGRLFSELSIGEGNVRGAMTGELDEDGSRIIPYERGTRKTGSTRYSLNTFFRDQQTIDILMAAGDEVRQYMETTGFGVISIWKTWVKYRGRLPRPLPKLGFYMMMRDVAAGALVYQEYPKVSYPGIQMCEGAYGWELYAYFRLCGHLTATCAEIMYFFVEVLGVQPSVANASVMPLCGLARMDDESGSPYEIKPPAEGVKPPSLLLPPITRYRDFSLVRVDQRHWINPYYLDEDGRALVHGAYVKLFFMALIDAGFAFSEVELPGLLDRGWCKKHLKTFRPVLKKASEPWQKGCGYYKQPYRFNGEDFLLADDWSARNKCLFDQWAAHIAKRAGIDFVPYDVKGLSQSAINDDSTEEWFNGSEQ